MASQQGPLREGGAWDGKPEPWRVGAAGTSKKAEVMHQHWLMEPPASEQGCDEGVGLLGTCPPCHDISIVALLAFRDSEPEPAPSRQIAPRPPPPYIRAPTPL